MNLLHVIGYHNDYGGGTVDWLTHVVVSSVINGLIYGLIFRAMHELTLGQAAVLVLVVLVGAFLWARSRDRQGW
jgi:hypothetical protein